MSWKSIVTTGLLCLIAAPAWAAASINVTSSYNSSLDVIVWEVTLTPSAGNTNAIAVEAPFSLAGDTTTPAVFDPNLRANSSTSESTHSAGDNNGTTAQTWYYNVDTNGTTRLWNTQTDAADIEQNVGANPFTGTNTEGLWLNTTTNQIFAALGSDINMPTPVKLLHIASDDGILSWSNLLVKEEVAGVPTQTLLSGFKSSIRKADMNGDGLTNFGDLGGFGSALTNIAAYNAANPGLDGRARADMNNDGLANFGDLGGFGSCLTNPGTCPPVAMGGGGAGGISVASGGGGVVPEPAAAALIIVACLGVLGIRHRK